jgi:putative Mg2+ transporter-C (MgtC) family protein
MGFGFLNGRCNRDPSAMASAPVMGHDVPMEPASIFSDEFLRNAGRVLAAFVLTLPIAWEREASTRIMGLRTLPLVAVASCAYILVGLSVAGGDPQAQGRLLSGLVAGIGFIGGGAILKRDDSVRGAATAASVLATGVLGAAVGYRLYGIALLISGITLATLLVLRPLHRRLEAENHDHDKPKCESSS